MTLTWGMQHWINFDDARGILDWWRWILDWYEFYPTWPTLFDDSVCYFVSRVMQQHPGEVWVIYELYQTQCHSFCPMFFATMWSSKFAFWAKFDDLKMTAKKEHVSKSHRVVTMGRVNILLQFESKDLTVSFISLTRNMYCMNCMIHIMYIEIASDIIDIFMFRHHVNLRTTGGPTEIEKVTHMGEKAIYKLQDGIYGSTDLLTTKDYRCFFGRVEMPQCFFGQKLKLNRFHCFCWLNVESGGGCPSSTVARNSTNQLRQNSKKNYQSC